VLVSWNQVQRDSLFFVDYLSLRTSQISKSCFVETIRFSKICVLMGYFLTHCYKCSLQKHL
jgi:hypothetical protein